jgi:hypothetical protein
LKDSGFADEYEDAVLLGLLLDGERRCITDFASESKGVAGSLTDEAESERSEKGEDAAETPPREE